MKKALSGSPYGNCTNEFSRFELLEIRLMFICTGILKRFHERKCLGLHHYIYSWS